MEKRERNITDVYHIWIGLKDADANAQLHSTDKYVGIVDYLCRSNDICFSMHIARGGCRKENGRFVIENSLNIILMGAQQSVVDKLAEELCALFGQECVLVLHEKGEMYFLSKKLM